MKDKAERDEAYLKFVRSLPCCITGESPVQAHHLVGHGESVMGSKCSDYYTIPLSPRVHSELHNHGFKSWEAQHGSQVLHVMRTQRKWIAEQRGRR